MSQVITHTETETLVVVKCWCGLRHAIPQSLRETQLQARDRGGNHVIFCPLGHEYIATGESRTAKLQRQLADEQARRQREATAAQARIDREKARADHNERRRRGEKGARTRMANRIHAGVCPCCNRFFRELHAHMQSQHPTFPGETAADAEPTGGES